MNKKKILYKMWALLQFCITVRQLQYDNYGTVLRQITVLRQLRQIKVLRKLFK